MNSRPVARARGSPAATSSRDCGVGVGKIALGGAAWASRFGRARSCRRPALAAESAGPQDAALRAQGEARDPSVHGRRAQPARPVRLQARAGAARGQAAAAVGHRRPALRVHPVGRRRARAAVQVRPPRPVRRRALGDAAAPGRASSTTSASSSRCTPISSITPRPRSSSTPASPSRAGRAWARGSLYGLGSESQDLPAFVVMSTGSGISGGAANWSSGFLPTVYTGVRLRNQGDPILNVSSPPGIDARAPARLARPGRRRSTAASFRRSATPRSPRASPPTRWPSGSRPPRPS